MLMTAQHKPCGTPGITTRQAVGSNPTKQHKNYDDDQNRADEADATVTVTVAVAAEAAAKAAEQENDEDDDKNESKRHGVISFGRTLSEDCASS
jgi:hypothetical protein